MYLVLRAYKRPTEGATWVKYTQNIDSEEKINFTEENENSVQMTRGGTPMAHIFSSCRALKIEN